MSLHMSNNWERTQKKERERVTSERWGGWGPVDIVRRGYSGAAVESAPDQSLTDITLLTPF